MSIRPQRIADLPRRNLFLPCFGFWVLLKGTENGFYPLPKMQRLLPRRLKHE